MTEKPDIKAGIEKLEERFGSRIELLFFQLQHLAVSGQPCDVTLYDSKPHLVVRINNDFIMALVYGAGAKMLADMLSRIKLSNGVTVNINDIWTINPMPVNGFTEEELANVDLAEAEEKIGSSGETLRKMISDTYHCSSRAEEDVYLRRFIAS